MAAKTKPKGDTARLVALDDLKPYPGNANIGDVEGLMESLEANDQYRPIVVNAGGSKSRMTILAGNHTAEAALRLGWKRIRVWFVDVDDAAARRINLVDNRQPEKSHREAPALAALLEAAQADGGLAGTGYSDDEAETMLATLSAGGAGAAAPEGFPPVNPDDLEIEHTCPKCGYEWSGKAS
jgi:ParB-like chromosome segregation protein Spo0J